MKRLLPALVLVSVTACGLADDERDEENKYIYPTFSDKTFEAYCLGEFDLDGNGRISRYEAQRVVRIDCSGRGIASLADVAEFANLRELDCRCGFSENISYLWMQKMSFALNFDRLQGKK